MTGNDSTPIGPAIPVESYGCRQFAGLDYGEWKGCRGPGRRWLPRRGGTAIY
jgi:hypothetical protein